MPIRVSCQCGKALSVKDAMAGKAVKCPGCGNVVRVPGGDAAAPAKAAAAAPAPVAPAAGGISDLFDEEGFSDQVAAVCPACRSELKAGAILCTKCGYNTQTGEQFEAHKLAGVDIDYGELALMKAESDLAADKKAQEDMVNKAGLPWWGLALILFMIGSSVGLAVITVNAARREEGKEFNFDPIATFYALSGTAFALVAAGALIKLIVHAIKKDAEKITIIKLVVTGIVLLGVAIGFFVAANSR